MKSRTDGLYEEAQYQHQMARVERGLYEDSADKRHHRKAKRHTRKANRLINRLTRRLGYHR